MNELAKEIREILTEGWSKHERTHWFDYLEEEVKPDYPKLYKFLKEFGEK